MDADHFRLILLILSELSPSTWDLAKSIYEVGSELTFESSDSPPTWCICGKSSVMLNERENVCCKNKAKNHEHPEFHQLVLDENVLDLAMKGNADWLCYIFNPNENSSWRYKAYRQFTLWHWGYLGRGNRKVIPSCVVEIIIKDSLIKMEITLAFLIYTKTGITFYVISKGNGGFEMLVLD